MHAEPSTSSEYELWWYVPTILISHDQFHIRWVLFIWPEAKRIFFSFFFVPKCSRCFSFILWHRCCHKTRKNTNIHIFFRPQLFDRLLGIIFSLSLLSCRVACREHYSQTAPGKRYPWILIVPKGKSTQTLWYDLKKWLTKSIPIKFIKKFL